MTDTMTPERFCKEKRTLQVLQSNYNKLAGWITWAAEVLLIIMIVSGLCGSVWSEGFPALKMFLVAFMSLVFVTSFWRALGTVYEESREVLAIWRHKEGLPLRVRKFLRSTRPVRVEIGTDFYADRSLVLTLLDIITTNTFNVLLAA